jgi:hypothetical protein
MTRDDASSVLVENCKRLCSVKYRIDDFIDMMRNRGFKVGGEAFTSLAFAWLDEIDRNPALDDELWLNACAPGINPPRRALYTVCTMRTMDFAECVLPFFRFNTAGSDGLVLADVNPFLVIGGTHYRNWPTTLSDGSLDAINETARTSTPGADTAYIRLDPLPLYVAYEGKNRVRAFRAAGRNISAFTYTNRFPDATTLQLHEVAGTPSFAVSDMATNELHALILPSLTVPLLESYGVPIGKRISRGMVRRHRSLKRAERALQSALFSHVMV